MNNLSIQYKEQEFEQEIHLPPERKPNSNFSQSHHLKEHYPDLLMGSALNDHAVETLKKSEAFSVFAIRIESSQKDPDTEAILDAACELLQGFRDRDSALWGLSPEGDLICYIPSVSMETCQERAQEVTNTIAGFPEAAAFTGIAGFPYPGFERAEIAENAIKAIDHAAFFGDGTVTPFDAVTLNISGDRHYVAGNLEKAMEEYKKALDLSPDNINVHNSMGVCHGISGNHGEALKCFESALRVDPEEIMAIHNAGLINLLMDRKEKALSYFRQAGDLGKEIFEVEYHTGKLYLEMAQAEKGVRYLEKAITLKPESSHAFRCLAECYRSLGRLEDAITAYKRAVKHGPGDAASLSGLAETYGETGRNLDIALILADHSVEIEPENADYLLVSGKLHLKNKNNEAALKLFERAEQIDESATEWVKKAQKLIP